MTMAAAFPTAFCVLKRDRLVSANYAVTYLLFVMYPGGPHGLWRPISKYVTPDWNPAPPIACMSSPRIVVNPCAIPAAVSAASKSETSGPFTLDTVAIETFLVLPSQSWSHGAFQFAALKAAMRSSENSSPSTSVRRDTTTTICPGWADNTSRIRRFCSGVMVRHASFLGALQFRC